jgi:hypothetical protein
MPQKDSVTVSDNSQEAYDPTFTGYATLFFFLDFLFLCLVEETVISGLWFGHGPPPDTYSKFSVPIFLLLPYAVALQAAIAVRKQSRKGQLQRTAAGRIQHTIGVLGLAAYLALEELARFAFR